MTRSAGLVICLLPGLFNAPVAAQVEHREIRPAAGSRLELRVYKTGIYKGKSHLFVFPEYSGMLDFDPHQPEASRVTLRIAAGSIQLLDTWLSAKDFKSVHEYALKEMLDAARNPEISFTSSGVRPSGSGFEVKGTLTIRRIAEPSVVNVSIDSAGQTFRGNARIRLTDYGLKPPTAGLGLVGTKDEMDFTFVMAVR